MTLLDTEISLSVIFLIMVVIFFFVLIHVFADYREIISVFRAWLSNISFSIFYFLDILLLHEETKIISTRKKYNLQYVHSFDTR